MDKKNLCYSLVKAELVGKEKKKTKNSDTVKSSESK